MAFTEGSSDGTLNGTTPVTVIAAPGAGVRRIPRVISIVNTDIAAVTVTLKLVNGSNSRVLYSVQLQVGDKLNFDDPIVLDAPNKSITAVMSGAATTTNPDWTATYGDAS